METALRCPACGTMTPSLKRYRTIHLLIFIGIGARTQPAVVTACPPCMRKHLLKRALINLLPANVLWPLIVLPFHGVQLLRSLAPGHSRSVRKALPA